MPGFVFSQTKSLYQLRRESRSQAEPAANAPAGDLKGSDGNETAKPVAPVDPGAVVAKLNDGGELNVVLVDESIEIAGRYGTLRIAPADILRIEVATRLPDAMQQQISKAIADLASPDKHVRAAAANRLTELGPAAYPAVLKAAENVESAAGKEAAAILDKIQESAGEDDLSPRTTDVIHTADSTIQGRIVTPALRVRTNQFGELSLKIADVRSLRSRSLPEEKPETADDTAAMPDPGTLSNYHNHLGQTLRFRVTGTADGSLWGSGVYTTDSRLSTAAVHAGAIKAGQTGIVTVKIVAGQEAYAGTVSNGVGSFGYGAYPVAFEFVTKRKRQAAPTVPQGAPTNARFR